MNRRQKQKPPSPGLAPAYRRAFAGLNEALAAAQPDVFSELQAALAEWPDAEANGAGTVQAEDVP